MKSKLAPLPQAQKHLKSLGFSLQKYWLELALISAGGLGLWLGSQQIPLLTQSQQLQGSITELQNRLGKATLQDKERFSLEKDLLALQKDKITLENTIRTNQLQGIGGALLVITAYVGWRNYQATQQKQVAERFSKAVEQLGNDNIHVRLGGIYALEQIAKDAEQKYYWQVMEILTAYVRERSPYQPETEEKTKTLATDIQALMTVLARRKHSYQNGEEHPLDLRKTNLRGLRLPPYANLKSMDFWNANLEGVELRNANLQNACFGKANLQEADLLEANLQNATLGNANLQRANLVKANLQNASLWNANLQEACLIGTNLQNAYLLETNLQGSQLWGTNLQEAYLNEANLRKASLKKVDLQGADLECSNLEEAGLEFVNLQKANLRGANLEGTVLMWVNLQQAKLRKDDKDAKDVVGLTWKQLQEAAFYEGAELPDYLLENPPEKTEASPTEVSTPSEQARDNSQEGLE